LFRRRPEIVETVESAGDRFESVQPGIVSRHCFSAGAHYDADRIAFGPLVGLDEHVVEPGAGFADHAHRGVEILTWVLDGVLRHEDEAGRVELVAPGTVLRQAAGTGIRHSEVNASDTEPLRFVQLTVLSAAEEPACTVTEPPVLIAGAGLFEVLTGKTELELSSAYLHATRGSFNITKILLQPGDSVRIARTTTLSGAGELLLWTPGAR
jgi:redox-sensitive bicupin YhaK (pirin superfamily)